MSDQIMRQAIELCYNKLRQLSYSSTVGLNWRYASFDESQTGACFSISQGRCEMVAVSIVITPMSDRFRRMTKWQCTGRTDEIVYAVDAQDPRRTKWVRCFILPNKKVSVQVRSEQVEDLLLIVAKILSSFA